jgi:hypothetical protein
MKSLREILDGPFAEWLGDDDWTSWLAFLSALRAEPMSRQERGLYRECTGRKQLPDKPFNEAWVVVGRKGRKSAIAAVLGVYFAVYKKWKRAPGETVRVLIVGKSKDQAKLVRDYCEAILESRPALQRLITSIDASSIGLSNGISIVCVANSYRSIRGPTVVCCIFDEVAFWYDEGSANPDMEVLRAVKPSMLTAPGALLIGLSSPYARRGLLWEKYKQHYGRDDANVLVWQAPTEKMNPQVDTDFIRQEYEQDPISAQAEYGAEFRTDVESFIQRDVVEACIENGVLERPPVDGIQYRAFVDPSGGSGSDSMALAIAHQHDGIGILDCLREIRPPFSPANAVAELSQLLRPYRITQITGDKYAGGFPPDEFAKHGITFEQSAKPKSEIYLHAVSLLNSRRVSLLDHPRLVAQICGLERRAVSGGRDRIDHPRFGNHHDDCANAALGALVELSDPHSAYTFALLNNVSTPRERGSRDGIPLRSRNPWHHPAIPLAARIKGSWF